MWELLAVDFVGNVNLLTILCISDTCMEDRVMNSDICMKDQVVAPNIKKTYAFVDYYAICDFALNFFKNQTLTLQISNMIKYKPLTTLLMDIKPWD